MNTYKLLPYGISDFRRIRKENYYYVDKSAYIQRMEDVASFLFLIRPRHFGKSLFLSMLRYYYDIKEKENFRELFKGLWVADHPTQWQGKFQVLHLDFSQVGGNADALPLNFNRYFGVRLDDFAERYAAYYPADFVERIRGAQDANTKFALIIAAASARNHKLYLIVDEYDNFTNTILNEEGEPFIMP